MTELPKIITSQPLLSWYPEIGYGYFPVDQFQREHDQVETSVYNKEYFEKYKEYTKDEKGRAINEVRKNFVLTHLKASVGVDIGVGCGTFVDSMGPNWYGYDVNPAGVEWLKSQGKYFNIYDSISGIDAFTFFDSLEHIRDLNLMFNFMPNWVFVSIPIFESAEHIQSSKHYRKDEHFHYFTHDAFVKMFDSEGYDLVAVNDMESDLGRDGIKSYAFKRKVPRVIGLSGVDNQ